VLEKKERRVGNLTQRGALPIFLSMINYRKISITLLSVLISRDLLKQRHIKNQERFIAARRIRVIVPPLSRD